MRLTGIPLILLVGAAGGATLIATVLRWPRGRPAIRTVGAVCAELLLLVTVALIWNREQTFYPAWSDLLGGTTAAAHPVEPLPSLVPWSGPGQLVLPPGYAGRPGLSFPVIVVLCDPAQAAAVRATARHLPDVVTAVLTPAPAGPAATLTGLPAELRRSARVTDHDWALVADRPHRDLATRLRDADPHFGAEPGLAGDWATALTGAADRLPAPLVEAVRR